MARRLTYLVSLEQPEEASLSDVKKYILDALCAWKGSLQPPGVDEGGINPDAAGDPMWDLSSGSITCKRIVSL